jgi:hypothetical protein
MQGKNIAILHAQNIANPECDDRNLTLGGEMVDLNACHSVADMKEGERIIAFDKDVARIQIAFKRLLDLLGYVMPFPDDIYWKLEYELERAYQAALTEVRPKIATNLK